MGSMGLLAYSCIFGHETKKSIEVYEHLSLKSVENAYQHAVQSVGVWSLFLGTKQMECITRCVRLHRQGHADLRPGTLLAMSHIARQ